MFVLTLNREALKKTALTAVCGVLLAGAVFAVNARLDRPEARSAAAGLAAPSTKIESGQDMASFFTAYGLEMDPATVTMDKVKIPRKWDDDFAAFDAEIGKCGLSLQKYKGKKVDKWAMLCPSLSTGEQKCYGVLLVYKKQAVGAYMLQQPSGEVTALTAASSAAAPLSPDELDAEFGPVPPPDAELAPPDASPEQPAQAPADEVLPEDAGAMPIE